MMKLPLPTILLLVVSSSSVVVAFSTFLPPPPTTSTNGGRCRQQQPLPPLHATINWVLESEVFPNTHGQLRNAIANQADEEGGDCKLVNWNDDWLPGDDGTSASVQIPKKLFSQPTVFHGSLGNAAYVHDKLHWTPGSFCDTTKFCCSYWYKHFEPYLIHGTKYTFTTVQTLVDNPKTIANMIGMEVLQEEDDDDDDNTSMVKIFVRPDSPLKPFSGRVVPVNGLSLRSLDHGFYYEELDLPVVVAPVRNDIIGDEFRFVVVKDQVIAGSRYDPTTRSPVPVDDSDDDYNEAFKFASTIAKEPFDLGDVYVVDVCKCGGTDGDGDWKLMEFNPFGGADLYACNAEAIVRTITDLVNNTN